MLIVEPSANTTEERTDSRAAPPFSFLLIMLPVRGSIMTCPQGA